MDKLRLHGFNNLTKSLSFNIYDICYARTQAQKKAYIAYLDDMFNADRLTQILTEVSDMIGAHILNVARQDYEPEGASVTILIAEETAYEGPVPDAVVGHLAELVAPAGNRGVGGRTLVVRAASQQGRPLQRRHPRLGGVLVLRREAVVAPVVRGYLDARGLEGGALAGDIDMAAAEL